MNVHVPRYENGELWWDKNDIGYDINTDDYIIEMNDINDIINFIDNNYIDTFEEYESLIEQINNIENKHLDYFINKTNAMKDRAKLVTKEMPQSTKSIYITKINVLMGELRRVIAHNESFIINNRDEIINIINNYKIKITNKLKEARARANKNYYEKCKMKINSVPKMQKTAEEIKEAQKIANKKSYEKRKALLNNEPKKLMTPEEIKQSKKQSNSKYYQSKKNDNNGN